MELMFFGHLSHDKHCSNVFSYIISFTFIASSVNICRTRVPETLKKSIQSHKASHWWVHIGTYIGFQSTFFSFYYVK